MTDLVVRGADLCDGRPAVDLRVRGERIVEVGRLRIGPADQVLDADGCAVLPGLHDHHVHLLAQAAALRSVRVGPPEVRDAAGFAAALRRADGAAPPGEWIRAVGYHDSVAGSIDRHVLDAVVPERPVRVQHRSGIEWTLSTAGLVAVGLHGPRVVPSPPPGVERDAHGRPTGRLRRADRWLSVAIGAAPPDLAAVGVAAASHGITGFTDATPFPCMADLAALRGAVAAGSIPQQVLAMTAPGVRAGPEGGHLPIGPVKVVLDDDQLPDLASLVRTIEDAHTDARPVAVHCVTRVQTVLTLSALGVAGVHRGDRIEHASVVPAELLAHLAGLGVTVVTNPGLVRSRGDRYLREVDRGDRGDLYRCRSLALAGVSVAAGTDAPFGPEDPWTVMATAVDRRTADGAPLGPDEAIPPDEALGLFLGEPEAPGRRRRVVVGARADLCVLGVPGGEMRRVLRAGETGCGTPLRSADVVAACVAGGRIVAERR